MKKLVGLLIVLIVSCAWAAPLVENENLRQAVELIEERRAGNVCESDAYQETIVRLIREGLRQAPAEREALTASIPADSDLWRNWQFKAALDGRDLRNINDTKTFENLLKNTRHFSRAGGVVGPAMILDLKAGGEATLIHLEWKNVVVESYYPAKWRAYVEVEPGGDYYHFVEVEVWGEKWLFLMDDRRFQGHTLMIKTSGQESDENYIFLPDPSDCEA